MEEFYIDTDPTLKATRPAISYAISYTNGSLSTANLWGTFAGTIGQKKKTRQIRIHISNPSYTVWYNAHNVVVGWQG